MVSILVISHSKRLADATVELISEMKSEDFILKPIGGIDNGTHFGTDPMVIKDTTEKVDQGDGVLIIADMGSSIMNTQMALQFLNPEQQKNIRIANAPFLEGSLTAVVTNTPGMTIDELEKLTNNTLGESKL